MSIAMCCPECSRDCDTVELAGYRTWCQQCWDKHVEPLLFPPCKGANLEKDSNGVWQWVEVAQFAEDEITQYYDEDQEIPA